MAPIEKTMAGETQVVSYNTMKKALIDMNSDLEKGSISGAQKAIGILNEYKWNGAYSRLVKEIGNDLAAGNIKDAVTCSTVLSSLVYAEELQYNIKAGKKEYSKTGVEKLRAILGSKKDFVKELACLKGEPDPLQLKNLLWNHLNSYFDAKSSRQKGAERIETEVNWGFFAQVRNESLAPADSNLKLVPKVVSVEDVIKQVGAHCTPELAQAILDEGKESGKIKAVIGKVSKLLAEVSTLSYRESYEHELLKRDFYSGELTKALENPTLARMIAEKPDETLDFIKATDWKKIPELAGLEGFFKKHSKELTEIAKQLKLGDYVDPVAYFLGELKGDAGPNPLKDRFDEEGGAASFVALAHKCGKNAIDAFLALTKPEVRNKHSTQELVQQFSAIADVLPTNHNLGWVFETLEYENVMSLKKDELRLLVRGITDLEFQISWDISNGFCEYIKIRPQENLRRTIKYVQENGFEPKDILFLSVAFADGKKYSLKDLKDMKATLADQDAPGSNTVFKRIFSNPVGAEQILINLDKCAEFAKVAGSSADWVYFELMEGNLAKFILDKKLFVSNLKEVKKIIGNEGFEKLFKVENITDKSLFKQLCDRFFQKPEYLAEFFAGIQKQGGFGPNISLILSEHAWYDLDYIRDYVKMVRNRIDVLHDKFGVEFFERFDGGIITNAYLTATVPGYSEGKRIALIVLNKTDYNHAFEQDKGLYHSLLNKGYNLIFCEANSDKEVAERFFNDGTTSGVRSAVSGRKYDLLILGGHGTPDNISFGGIPVALPFDVGEDLSKLDLGDYGKPGFTPGSWNKKFVQDATIILMSCSTGKDIQSGEVKKNPGNFSNMMAMIGKLATNTEVFAPNVDTSGKSLVFDSDGKCIGIEYYSGETKKAKYGKEF